MIRVIKNKGNIVKAYRLGEENRILNNFMYQGRIKKISDDSYEVFSQEAVNGKGEIAFKGDYIKVDSKGFPYPNKAVFFCANHRWIEEDIYEQIPKVLDAWTVSDPMCEEIQFLIREKGLEIQNDDFENYFSAPLWGTKESAARDAVIVFYNISRDAENQITDIDFNFVCRSEFNRIYTVL